MEGKCGLSRRILIFCWLKNLYKRTYTNITLHCVTNVGIFRCLSPVLKHCRVCDDLLSHGAAVYTSQAWVSWCVANCIAFLPELNPTLQL